MTTDTIRALWKPAGGDTKAGVAWWDGSAEKFAAKELPAAESSLTMRLIAQEGMVTPGCRGLDVGCGAGRFSFALEALGAEMTATDFSPRMISLAEAQGAARGSGVRFSVDDWHTLDLSERGWESRFDLVLANMTPAVASADTFLKLSKASRNWVLMVKPARRTNSVLDALNSLTGAPTDRRTLDEAIAYAFDLAWLSGFQPRLTYQRQVWNSDMPLEEAVEAYTLRIASVRTLTGENRRDIRNYLTRIAADGRVREETHTLIAAMYWQVNPA